jgi:hypothetical protein
LKKPRSWVGLIVSAIDLDPKFATNLLHIQPSYSHESSKGEFGDDVYGFWQLNSTLADDDTIENHLWYLLKKLAPVRHEFKKLLETTSAHFYCSVEYADNETDGIDLTPRVLTLIGNLGVRISIHQWKEKRFDAADISFI